MSEIRPFKGLPPWLNSVNLWRAILASKFPSGSAEACAKTALTYNFYVWAILFPSLLHGCYSWELSSINFIQANLCFESFCGKSDLKLTLTRPIFYTSLTLSKSCATYRLPFVSCIYIFKCFSGYSLYLMALIKMWEFSEDTAGQVSQEMAVPIFPCPL